MEKERIPRSRYQQKELVAQKVEHIDITPVGLQTPEGIKRVNKALDAFNASAHAVANELSELLDAGNDLDEEQVKHLRELLSIRRKHQDAFLLAVAGNEFTRR